MFSSESIGTGTSDQVEVVVNATTKKEETSNNNSAKEEDITRTQDRSNMGKSDGTQEPAPADIHQNFGTPESQHGISDLPKVCRADSAFTGRFEEEEQTVRRKAKHSELWLAIVNGYSAVLVFAYHLISLESILSIALSVSMTVFTYFKTVSLLLIYLSRILVLIVFVVFAFVPT